MITTGFGLDCKAVSPSQTAVQSVTVTVPCSTSNLGSGFDTLGLALALHNRVTVARRRDTRVRIVSKMPVSDRPAAETLVREAAELFFKHTKTNAMGIDVAAEGNIPIARGLGYSSTLRAGIIAALNELTATQLSRHDIVHLVTQLEGHPDNASPAVLGGFTVSGIVNKRTGFVRFDVEPTLKAVTLVPDFQVRTSAARKLLPKQFSRADAAHALNRSALIVAAFAAKDYEALRGLFDDRFHQPYRLTLVPQLDGVVRAGVEAGAIGGFLSGSGSAIICLVTRNLQEVGAAMKSQLPQSEVKILSPENDGLRVEKA
jgi:homoserine kinase